MRKYILFLCSVLFIFSCEFYNSPADTHTGGIINLTITSMIYEKTILPEIDMTIASYDISGSGPGGDNFIVTGYTGSTWSCEVSETGDWTITVCAYNASGDMIGRGDETITIFPGETTPVSVYVTPLEEPGTLDISLAWPDVSVVDPVITGTLESPGGLSQSMLFTLSGNSAGYTNDSMDPGYYLLHITVADGSVEIFWILETIRIIANAVTSANFTLPESDSILSGK
jgi:hypothetical protein